MENRWIVFLLMLVPLTSCGQKNDSLDEELKTLYKRTVPVISMEDAQKSANAKILDTREPKEFEVSHLPKAKLVGYDDFDLASVKSIPKQDTIIVYCSVGYRSERIGEKLQKAGYTHVFNLYGGIFNWKNHNGVVLDTKNDTTEKVHTYNKDWSRFLKNGEKVY
ncbi:MAG: rhodanese-like domain-containing protein [Flavobacteriales bacterium]|nr:rhodanese-like domain-containing protein [Flavobacteriales bacterium]